MVKKLRKLNLISAIMFFLSSFSLLFIPFLKFDDGMPRFAYAIALTFWVGLLLGCGLQIFITIKCKKMHLQKKTKKALIPLCISAIAFLTLLVQILISSGSVLMEIMSLFVMIISLQYAVVITRKGCLK